MAFCNNCGRELREGIKFCEMCGMPVTIEQASQSGKAALIKQCVNGLFYGVPVFVSGLIGLLFGLFGYFVFLYDNMGHVSIFGDRMTKQELAEKAYQEASLDMDKLIVLGIVLMVIGIIIWAITTFVKPPQNNMVRMLLWGIPLIAVLIVTGILYAPCLAYVTEYGFLG